MKLQPDISKLCTESKDIAPGWLESFDPPLVKLQFYIKMFANWPSIYIPLVLKFEKLHYVIIISV